MKEKEILLENVKRGETNQENCFAMIMLLANRFQTKLDNYTGDITMKQWLLLCMLEQIDSEEVSVNELASVVGYSRQNVKKMVDLLVAKGYLELEASKKDKRAYHVKVTAKTKAFFDNFKNLGDEILQRLFNGIPEQELIAAMKVMTKMSCNIETM